MKLEDDRYCFVCGEKNRYGLNLKFTVAQPANNRSRHLPESIAGRVGKDSVMHTEFIPQKQHQGFKDIVHGGLIGLILDEIMVNLAWRLGRNVVSAEINIRLKKTAKVGEKLVFKGWIDKEEKRIIYTKAEAKDQTGAIIATASAKCVRVMDN